MAEMEALSILQKVKINLGIDDNIQDDLLCHLIDNVVNHFRLAYATDSVDARFGFIIEECVLKRFNRRGAEGATSETVDGHSVFYETDKYEFLPYNELLQREFNTGKAKSGRMVFL